MSRAQLTALMTALAVGVFAPRLAAQDTSTTRETRPDTSGYNGTAGVDTTAQPGRVGAIDTSRIGGADTMGVPGRADRDSTGPLGASDSSGMGGRHPNVTPPGDSTSPTDSSSMSDSTSSDSAGVSQPSKQPGQSTSRTGDSTGTGP